MSRIGPHGEVYPTKPTREQTFRQEGIIRTDDWNSPHSHRSSGPRALAAMLHTLADNIDLYARKDAFVTDPGMPPFSNSPSTPITTPLVSVELYCHVEDPPMPYLESYRVQLIARLGFE